MREFLWMVYKWGLVGLCMYICYRVLHYSPDLHFVELFVCTFITGCFILVILCHKALKKKVEQPNIFDNSIAFFSNLVNFIFYFGLYTHSIYSFDFTFRKTLPTSHILFLVVLYGVVPILYNFLFLD